ncbi:OmpP1/FadL family transporter [Microbaculum marinum]|uniref:Outer membrane protein transport protein n=1 Tax=Microbaculum marinum TaxID=1764581 RepID=A0AAW9RQ31_9HYPH
MRCANRRGTTSWTAISAGAVGLSTLLATEAFAGAFAIREQSAYRQGASFAGEAVCGDSVAGAFWNPAVVSCADGLEVEGSLSVILPQTDVTTDPFPGSLFGPGSPLFFAGDPGDIGEVGWVPAATAAYNFDNNWYFGVTINGPFGLATDTNFNHAAQIYGRKSEVFSLNVNPIVGYRFNDYFALAAGIGVEYIDIKLTQAVSPAPFAPSAELSGDDVGVGATVGILITPSPDTEIGIGYRSPVKHSVDGTLTIPLTAQLPVSVEPTLPEMISASFSHRFTDAFTLMGTAEWTNWSRFGTFTVTNDLTGLPATFLPFEYKDGWFFSLGGEYDWNDQWTLRAGVGWEISPVDDADRAIRLPDDDRLWLSIGGSYDWNDRLKLNFGYSFLTTFDTRIAIGPGNPLYVPPVTFAADVDANVHILSVGLKYRFGGAPEPVEEIVYKN